MALTQLLLASNVKCQKRRPGQKLMLSTAFGETGGRRNTSLPQRPINYGFHRMGNCSTEGNEANFRGGVIIGPAKDVMMRSSKQSRHAEEKVRDGLRRYLSLVLSFGYFVRKVKSVFYNNGCLGDAVSDSRVGRINEATSTVVEPYFSVPVLPNTAP